MKAPRRRRNLTPCTITFLPSPANAKWVFTEPNSTATTHKLFVHVEICLEITKWSVYPTCTLVQRLEYGFHRCLSHWFEMEMKSRLALEKQWVFPPCLPHWVRLWGGLLRRGLVPRALVRGHAMPFFERRFLYLSSCSGPPEEDIT